MELHKEYLTCTVSFFVLAITWHNLHNTFQIVQKINGQVLWANTLLLFVISFFPYVTTFVSNNFHSIVAKYFYGIIFFLISVMYVLLCFTLHLADKDNQTLFKVVYRPKRFAIYFAIQVLGFLVGYRYPSMVMISTILATIVWIVPERKAEIVIKQRKSQREKRKEQKIIRKTLLNEIKNQVEDSKQKNKHN